MDFRKLGAFALMLGLIVVGGGLVMFLVNQPLQNGDGLAGLVGAVANYSENLDRERSRKTAVETIIGGGIILFVGFAIRHSARH